MKRIFAGLADRAHTRDLILTPISSSFSNITHLSPLNSSDYCLLIFYAFLLSQFTYPTLAAPFEVVSADWNGFREFLPCYPWDICCVESDGSLSVSNFTKFFQGLNLYIAQFYKCGKPRSPEWSNHACNRVVCKTYRRWHRLLYRAFRNRFVQDRTHERLKIASFSTKLNE